PSSTPCALSSAFASPQPAAPSTTSSSTTSKNRPTTNAALVRALVRLPRAPHTGWPTLSQSHRERVGCRALRCAILLPLLLPLPLPLLLPLRVPHPRRASFCETGWWYRALRRAILLPLLFLLSSPQGICFYQDHAHRVSAMAPLSYLPRLTTHRTDNKSPHSPPCTQ